MSDAVISTLKRLAVFLLGIALDAFDKKMGLNLDPAAKASVTALVATYIGQSMYHSVQKIQADAAARADADVKTLDDAANVLAGPAKVLAFVLAAALLLPSAARAEDAPADAPKMVNVTAGYVVPAPGLYLPEAIAIADAKRIVKCEDERDKLTALALTSTGPQWWVLTIAAVVGAGLGAGAVLYLRR